MRVLLLAALCGLLSASVRSQLALPAETETRSDPSADALPQPVLFVPHAHSPLDGAGQPTHYVARSGNLVQHVTPRGLALQLLERVADGQPQQGSNLLLDFVGANPDAGLSGDGAAVPVRRYAGGDAREQRAWPSLRLANLYPGIDLRLLERGGRLSYDLLLAPGARPADVVVAVQGAQSLSLVAPDLLRLQTAAGVLEQTLPAAWQELPDGTRQPVQARFVLLDQECFGFAVDDHDPVRPLVIDPGLEYGTYLGGTLLDRAAAVQLAANGDVLLAGVTFSPDFPNSFGAWQEDLAGNTDAFIARLNPVSGALVFATFLGGADSDFFAPEQARGVVEGGDGSIYVTGDANSPDFPITPGGAEVNRPGGVDAFVACLDATGLLQWSTYVGGMGNDSGKALAVDAQGRVTVVGTTFSNDLPVTPGAYDQTFSSIFFTSDLFAARLAADGSVFDFVTYVGGSLREEAFAVALDGTGAATLVGLTGSADFPTTPGAYDETYNGGGGSDSDAFVLRLAADGSALQWSTVFGGVDIVEGRALALTASGAAVFGGVARSADLPVGSGALQSSLSGPSDGFLARLSPDGSLLSWATYLGGSGEDDVTALALSPAGQPTATGSTTSTDFSLRPASPVLVDGDGARGSLQGGLAQAGPAGLGGAAPVTGDGTVVLELDGELGGPRDAFVVRLVAGGGSLLYGSYHGGSDVDIGHAVALDDVGAAYVVGETSSTDLPVSANAGQASLQGVSDAFVARFSIPPWERLAAATPARGPVLTGQGTLEAGTPFRVDMARAAPEAPAWLVVAGPGQAAGPLVAWPPLWILTGRTSAGGDLEWWNGRWPSAVPSGTQLVMQAWSAPQGSHPGGLSRALRLITP